MPFKDEAKKKEYARQYHQLHKERASHYEKEYRQQHKQELAEHKKQYAQEHKAEISAYQTQYRQEHAQELQNYQVAYRKATTDKRLAWQRKYNRTHRTQRTAYHQLYNEKHREELKQYHTKYGNEYQLSSKIIVLTHYGNNKLACVRCGYDNVDALTIDHINGGGNQHRKSQNITHFYDWLINNQFPSGYRTLCTCCQQEVRYENKPYADNDYLWLKLNIFQHYSDGKIACKRCGRDTLRSLVLDHINGNGNIHRHQEHITSGAPTYKWIIKNNYPPIFQILCFNCNALKKHELKEYGVRSNNA